MKDVTEKMLHLINCSICKFVSENTASRIPTCFLLAFFPYDEISVVDHALWHTKNYHAPSWINFLYQTIHAEVVRTDFGVEYT